MLDNEKNTQIEIRKGSSTKGALIGIFLILISVAGYTFFTQSLSTEVSVLQADIETKNQTVQDLQTQIEELETAEEQLDLSTEVQRREILKSVPPQMYQDEVIRDIIDISEAYDVTLLSLGFGEGVDNGTGILRINSSFEGNYNDLISFLEGLEQNTRLFKVNSISVQISELDVLASKRVTFSLSLEAFFQK